MADDVSSLTWPEVLTLNWSEQQDAILVGGQRRIKAIARNRSEPYGTPKDDLWMTDIESSAAELAVAKLTGLYWHRRIEHSLETTPPDVGDDVQVRWSAHPTAHLTIYDRDQDGHIFFLVTGRIPTLVIHGWINAVEAKTENYRRVTPRGGMAYWVPQTDLNPISLFRKAYA